MRELKKIRRAMSSETKERFQKGADEMAKVGAYCKILMDYGIIPQDDLEAYKDFGGFVLLLGEEEE